jgi:hypothetical protein
MEIRFQYSINFEFRSRKDEDRTGFEQLVSDMATDDYALFVKRRMLDEDAVWRITYQLSTNNLAVIFLVGNARGIINNQTPSPQISLN